MIRRLTTRVQWVVLTLLLGAFALTGVLVFSAYSAERARARAVERAMQDYAAFANWQLGRLVRDNVVATEFLAFYAAVPRMRNPRVAAGLSARDFGATSCLMPEPQGCADSARAYFRYDAESRVFETAPPAGRPSVAFPWLQPALERLVQESPRLRRGRPQRVPPRSDTLGEGDLPLVNRSNYSFGTLFAEDAGGVWAVAFLLVRFIDGSPAQVYGVVVPARQYLVPLLAGIVQSERLLPASVIGEASTDSILGITLATEGATTLFASGRDRPGAFVHQDSLDALFGHLQITTSLAPQVAGRLAVESRSPLLRLPVLVCLLLMIAALISVTVVQLQRQQNFVHLRSEFVAGVSHELRTPLAQIRLLAELLRMGKPLSAADRDRSLRIIDQEARRLSYLVENVLAYSRPGARQLTLHAAPLREHVESTLEAFAPLALSRHAQVSFDAVDDPLVALDGDAFRQILINLLANAVRYGRMDQTVIVTLASEQDRVLLSVDDEGPGVPAAERNAIWEPYFRLPRDEGGPQGGTGLGLAVVRDLVIQHGGDVWVEEGVRGGARFVVAFPMARREMTSALPASADRPAPDRRTLT